MQEMDAKQFIQLFEATKDGLYRLFRKQGIENNTIEDLVQECYLRLWEKREGLQDPKAYLFGIAFNLSRNFHRKRMRMVIEQRETNELPDLADHYSQDEQYRFKETSVTVKKTIDGLSPKQKAAFTLIKEEERSYKEAAKLTGVPVSTLQKQVADSLRILRKVLAIFF